MQWSNNTDPKSIGWYLCTLQIGSSRFVMPIQRSEYPDGNFYWNHDGSAEIIACAKFLEPYQGGLL